MNLHYLMKHSVILPNQSKIISKTNSSLKNRSNQDKHLSFSKCRQLRIHFSQDVYPSSV